MYENFQLAVGSNLHITWDEVNTHLQNMLLLDGGTLWTPTTANFHTDGYPAFLHHFFPSNDFLIQGNQHHEAMPHGLLRPLWSALPHQHVIHLHAGIRWQFPLPL